MLASTTSASSKVVGLSCAFYLAASSLLSTLTLPGSIQKHNLDIGP